MTPAADPGAPPPVDASGGLDLWAAPSPTPSAGRGTCGARSRSANARLGEGPGRVIEREREAGGRRCREVDRLHDERNASQSSKSGGGGGAVWNFRIDWIRPGSDSVPGAGAGPIAWRVARFGYRLLPFLRRGGKGCGGGCSPAGVPDETPKRLPTSRYRTCAIRVRG